jgi:hypothetical protein
MAHSLVLTPIHAKPKGTPIAATLGALNELVQALLPSR